MPQSCVPNIMLSELIARFEQLKSIYQDPSDLKARVIRGVTWSIIGVIAAQGLKLLSTFIIARSLGDVGYGELGIINSTVVTFGVFAGLGLGITATKYIAELRIQDAVRAGQVIGFLLKLAFVTGGLMTLLTLLFAPLIAEHILNASHLTVELRIGSFLLFLNALTGVQIGALAGLESFRAIAIITIIEGVLHFILISLGAVLFGLIGAVVAYMLVAAVKLALSQWTLQKSCQNQHITISYKTSHPDWHILWTFALPALFISLSSQPFSWLSRVMLTSQPEGYADLGLFNAAFSWTIVLLFLPRQILRPSVSILSNLFAERLMPQFQRLVRMNLVLVVGLSAAAAGVLILFSPLIMQAYGDDFSRGTNVLIIILIAYVFSSSTLVFRDVMTSIGEMWWQVVFTLMAGIVLIISLPIFGRNAVGLASAYLLSYISLAAIQSIYWVFHIRRKLSVVKATASH